MKKEEYDANKEELAKMMYKEDLAKLGDKRKAEFLKNLASSVGILKTATAMTKISRSLYYIWIHEKGKEANYFRKRVEQVIEEQKDVVEAMLLNNIKKGHPASIMFYLKTKAKDRGYVERFEVAQNIESTEDINVADAVAKIVQMRKEEEGDE